MVKSDTVVNIHYVKKIIALLISISCSLLFASSNPWALKSIQLGLGNDKWAYGLSRNDDDQLSYSEHVAISGDRWFFNANLDGITNRGWKTGWDIRNENVEDWEENTFYNGRIDVTELIAGYRWTPYSSKLLSLDVVPETGLVLAGNMHFEVLQNTIHKISKIHEVYLPYDFDDVRPYYYLGLSTSARFHAYSLEKSQFDIAFNAKVNSAICFESAEDISIKLALENGYNDFVSFSFGYKWVQEHSSSPTMELYSRYLNSPYFSYTINTGLLSLRYFSELTDHFGYAIYSVDIMSLMRHPIWTTSDIYYSAGVSFLNKMAFSEQELEVYFTPHWSGVLKNRYVAGYPIDKEDEKIKDLTMDAREKQAYSAYTLGAKYRYSFLNGYLTPYVSMSLGFMKWNLTYLLNMQRDSIWPSYDMGTDFSFALDAEVGLTILPEGLIKADSSTISFTVFTGLSYVTGDFVSTYRHVTSDEDLESNIKDNFLFRYGAMIRIGFDL